MAAATERKRRHSPVNYKLLHESGIKNSSNKRSKLPEYTDSSDEELDRNCHTNANGAGLRSSTGIPDYSHRHRIESENDSSDSESRGQESSSDADLDVDKRRYYFGRRDCEIVTDYSSDGVGSESESDDDLPDPSDDLPEIVRPNAKKSNYNSSSLYSTHFSDTESESESSVQDFVDSWIDSKNNNSPTKSGLVQNNHTNSEATSSDSVQFTKGVIHIKPVRKMTDPNSSAHWRELGNQIYITAHENLSPVIRRDRLRLATNNYYKAYNFSKTEDEKVSASKNLGMASWRMAQVEEKALERLSVLVYFYKEAFKYLSLSWRDSEDIKPQNWRDGLLASAKTCWEEMKSGRISEMPVDERKIVFHDAVSSVQILAIKADVYIHLASCHFHSGITAIQTEDYKKGLYEMKECYMPIHESKNCGKGIMAIEAEARILEEDVFMHSCMAESIQAREIGDGIFRKVMLDEENLQMDMVYELIDWYKQAILRTREVTEVEMEAIALSRMGRVYDKILKVKYKAKEYLMKCMQLALSMHPRTFHGEDWFMECSEILERYQKETVQEEEAKWQKEREGLLKELSKEMNDIEKNDEKSGEEFLKFVYRVHPPKNPKHKLVGVPRKKDATIERDQLKKTLQKAIVHYHPDRVDSEKHGKTWKVLAEEITKCLTRRYECFKG